MTCGCMVCSFSKFLISLYMWFTVIRAVFTDVCYLAIGKQINLFKAVFLNSEAVLTTWHHWLESFSDLMDALTLLVFGLSSAVFCGRCWDRTVVFCMFAYWTMQYSQAYHQRQQAQADQVCHRFLVLPNRSEKRSFNPVELNNGVSFQPV